jgi:hypothetical protein
VYDAEDLDSSDQKWEINDMTMNAFCSAYERLKGFFDESI